MLRLAVLAASAASFALGAVTDVCTHPLLRQMQEYRDFQPAMDRCALHYAGQTTTKTLANTCLTTTQTVILGTSTVHATTHMACPTENPRMDLVRRGEHHDRQREHDGHHREEHGPHHDGDHPGHKNGKAYGHHELKKTKPHNGGGRTHIKTRTVRTHATGYHTHTPPATHGHGPHPSQPPAFTRRDVLAKREAPATKTADWSGYYASLADCGYDCIQRACSCVGTLKVVLQTPAPTCTSTLTTETVVHETKTVEVPAADC